MDNSTIGISNALLAAPYELNIWIGLFLWLSGNVGCVGNTIVFRSRSFRDRAYSIYLFTKAMCDFFYFNFLLFTRVLQKGFQIPISTRYDAICKFRQFISIWGNQVSFTLFAFATIDRLLSAQRSNIYRRWSNRRSLAYKLSIACFAFWLLVVGHRLVLYSASNHQCTPRAGFYADYDTYSEVILAGICPPMTMFVLASLLIRSVRGVLQRRVIPAAHVLPTGTAHRTILQQMDSQLTLMLILESIVTIITYLPYAAELIYTNVTQHWPKSSLRIAQEKVFVELIHLFSYLFFASSFYVSVISNNGFRRHVKHFFLRQTKRNATDHTRLNAVGTAQSK